MSDNLNAIPNVSQPQQLIVPQAAPPPSGVEYLTELSQGGGLAQSEPKLIANEDEGTLIYTQASGASYVVMTLYVVPRYHRLYGSAVVTISQSSAESSARSVGITMYFASFQDLLDSVDLVRANDILKFFIELEVGTSVNRFLPASDQDFLCGHATLMVEKDKNSAAAKERYADTYGNFNCNCDSAEYSEGSPLFKVCETFGQALGGKSHFGLTGTCLNFILDIREVYSCDLSPEVVSPTDPDPIDLFGFYAKIRTRTGIHAFHIASTSNNPFDTDSYTAMVPAADLAPPDMASIFIDRPDDKSFLSAVGVEITS